MEKKVKANIYFDFLNRIYENNSYGNQISTDVTEGEIHVLNGSGPGRRSKTEDEDEIDTKIKETEDKYLLIYDRFRNNNTQEDFSIVISA